MIKDAARWPPLEAAAEEQKTLDATDDSCRAGWSGTFEQLEAHRHRS